MATMPNTAFEVKVSNHEFDSTANITGYGFHGASGAVDVFAGALCVKSQLATNEGYPSGVLNGNTWDMVLFGSGPAFATLKPEPIYACNTFNVNELTDPTTGEVYKVNGNTLGLPLPAGKPGTFTRIDFDNGSIYRFGVGNIPGNTQVTAGDYLVPALEGTLAVAGEDTAPAAGDPVFQVLGTGTFTAGAWAAFDYVDVLACRYA